MITFENLGVDKDILRAIKDLSFVNPMPIQEKVIPYLIGENSGDLLALAQTGTGKTAAFGIPLIQKIDTKKKIIQALILAPTRELCLQISNDIIDYAKYKPELKITAVFGGASIENQIKSIKKGTHIISATPGRLIDLINRGVIDLTKINTVVLDEADEMLNMGFREDLEEILKSTPNEKNTLLFSATMPKEISAIANRYMKNPTEISVGKRNTGAENVNHIAYMVHAKDRYLALKRVVDFHPNVYGIIFCRTRKETQEVADLLIKDGYNADSLHGDLSQVQRDTVMNKFRIKHIQLLVATDVAARGLDVDNLTHIINYNLPDELEIYTHRSGRTGRAGKNGTSIIISNMREKGKIQQIEKILGKKFEHLNIPIGKEICEKQLFHLIDRMEKVEVDTTQIESFLPNIYKKLEWLDREELIKKFVSLEFNRFLGYYKNASDLNVPDDRRKAKRRDSGDGYAFTRFFINLGKTDDLNPTQLIGMINDFTNVRNIEIGDIEILKNFSFFEIDSKYADTILKSFKNKKLKHRDINVEVSEKKRTESRGRWDSKDFPRKKSGGKFEGRTDKKKSNGKFAGGKFSGKSDKKRSEDKPSENRSGKKKENKGAWRNR
ncbi:MAG: DEAD/DEAH box helicase [Ignavibacteriae bacterium HGW-Ignavibacteriae-2]|jgi:ATP-dependent RNA helicase DeaD|nr:DEAD/DEAH box helicase [Bacteroidota bacterium]PKL87782.1 MAG: DEAD/DEAH box helicase [Ignavibacteriae bacterium HGW-Ignavibacteriae-2]